MGKTGNYVTLSQFDTCSEVKQPTELRKGSNVLVVTSSAKTVFDTVRSPHHCHLAAPLLNIDIKPINLNGADLIHFIHQPKWPSSHNLKKEDQVT